MYDAQTLGRITYPQPTMPAPDIEELYEMVEDGIMEATDGCPVEPDGICEHSHPSWLIAGGLI